MPRVKPDPHLVRTRMGGGCVYYARCQGKSATSTSSAEIAARRAAEKAFGQGVSMQFVGENLWRVVGFTPPLV